MTEHDIIQVNFFLNFYENKKFRQYVAPAIEISDCDILLIIQYRREYTKPLRNNRK
jgi:hypothetical protein